MSDNQANSPNQPSAESEKRANNQGLWLIGGLLALGALMLACLTATSIGVFVLRGIQHARSVPPVVVQLATPLPAAGSGGEISPITPSPQAAAPAAAGRIAFIDPEGRLGTVAPDGADSRLLSRADWRFQFPAWSPDGGYIATIGSDGERGTVRLFTDEPVAREIEVFGSRSQAPIYLYWSPDGQQISFLANSSRGLGLWLAPASAQTDARLLANGQPFYWDWSDDSAQLLVHTGVVGDTARLAFIDTNGDTLGDAIAEPGLFQAPGLSSDGSYLAYADTQGEDLRVVIENRQGGARSTAPHAGLVALSWSPADALLAFTSPRTPKVSFIGPLRLLDAATGEVRTLVNDNVAGFFWSPDGRAIAYLTLESDAAGPGAARPAGLAAPGSQPGWQTDHPEIRLKLWVVDVAGGQERLLTSFKPTDLFVTQFLPFFDQYALSHRIWSPSGDAIVLPMVESNGSEAIYVIPANGGVLQRIAEGSMAFWSQQ